MCIFCVGDDGPFYLRKSAAFPRKMVAEAVEADPMPCEKAQSATGASDREDTRIKPTRLPDDESQRATES